MKNTSLRLHNNNFGILRLLFASLVIVSHSPELIDGNRSREILTSVFDTMSFGEISVDAFFLISGYLISQSFERSRTIWSYIAKRVGRIVPGFLACFVFCLFVIGPVGGGSPFGLSVTAPNIKNMLLLWGPTLPGIFDGLPYPVLNGSLWTISHEFRCYLLVIPIGFIGLMKGKLRFVIAGLAFSLLFLNGSGLAKLVHIPFQTILGSFETDARLVGIFLTGVVFNIFRERVFFTGRGAAIASFLLIACMFSKILAEAAFAIFGGYLIFWFAFCIPSMKISQIAEKHDISYGMYLYAWPIQMCLIWWGMRNPWAVCILTIPVAAVFAAISWKLIEEPFKKLSSGKKMMPAAQSYASMR